ncbi:735_t:CDS:2 [Acaulospora colombiana]|uniref:735_t:CDS:1 n=1 Tax=Acaulospora colombiana TaxID=27376 RepID=A0ACA9Q776_9GLOM|nr:735_t:CDS:2 [Acaulospora colombiana]
MTRGDFVHPILSVDSGLNHTVHEIWIDPLPQHEETCEPFRYTYPFLVSAIVMVDPSSTRSITRIPDGEFEFLRVYYDKKQWRERIEALRATQTPDMIALATVEGYDMIENL